MSGAMFMEIDGIKGESQFKGHEGQIDIESWSWGLTQPTSTHTGGGGTSGKANVGDLSFVHKVDKSSPNLMQASGNCLAMSPSECRLPKPSVRKILFSRSG